MGDCEGDDKGMGVIIKPGANQKTWLSLASGTAGHTETIMVMTVNKKEKD